MIPLLSGFCGREIFGGHAFLMPSGGPAKESMVTVDAPKGPQPDDAQ
jgi:hypothetical protein